MPKGLAEAEKEARSIVNRWSIGASLVGFIPGATLLLFGADIKMVHDVAKAFDVKHYNIEELSAAIGATIAGKTASVVFTAWFPVVGWAINAGIAGSVTKTVGEIVISHFRGKSELS